MCGIVAANFKKNLTELDLLKIDLKLKILGLFNQSRGTDSCGLYMNKRVWKGFKTGTGNNIKDTSKFVEFLGDPLFTVPKVDTAISSSALIHTRSSSVGWANERNAHPFVVQDKEPGHALVGVHNGTIKNIWTLCPDFGLKGSDFDVDSHALMAMMVVGGYKRALEAYRGGAALAWVRDNEPTSLYIYHGASKNKKEDETPSEERPMFYMKTDEGIYFSSIAASLRNIQEHPKQKVMHLECNVIHKVTNGKLTNWKEKIDREDVNIEAPTTNYYKSYTEDWPNTPGRFSNHKNSHDSKKYGRWENNKWIPAEVEAEKSAKFSILDETMPDKSKAFNTVFYHKGRHWFKSEHGYLVPCSGIMYINKKGRISIMTDITSRKYYFFRGVMLKGEGDHAILMERIKSTEGFAYNNNKNFALYMSNYSMYPVTNLNMESTEICKDHHDAWYFKGVMVTEKFSPLFSSRCYCLKKGELEEITSSIATDKIMFKPSVEDKPAIIISPSSPIQSKLALDAEEDDEYDGYTITPPKIIKDEGSIFDMRFNSFEGAVKIITNQEWLALMMYAKSDMTKTAHLEPDEIELHNYVLLAIHNAVTSDVTLREIMDDKDHELDVNLSIIVEDDLTYEKMNMKRIDTTNTSKLAKNVKAIIEMEEIDDESIEDAELAYESGDAFMTMEEQEQIRAEDEIDSAINILEDLDAIVEELGVINCDLAKEAAFDLAMGKNNILEGLMESAKKAKCTTILKKITKSITV